MDKEKITKCLNDLKNYKAQSINNALALLSELPESLPEPIITNKADTSAVFFSWTIGVKNVCIGFYPSYTSTSFFSSNRNIPFIDYSEIPLEEDNIYLINKICDFLEE